MKHEIPGACDKATLDSNGPISVTYNSEQSDSAIHGGHWGGGGFLGPVGHREIMIPSIMNLERRSS